MTSLRDKTIDGLKNIPYSILNGDPVCRLPGNVNVCFEGVEAEALLFLLDQAGICASSGSACMSGSLEPSLEDMAITRVLCSAGRVLQIPVLDHIIVGKGGLTSICRMDPGMFEKTFRPA